MKRTTALLRQLLIAACTALLLFTSGCARHASQQSSDTDSDLPATNNAQPIRVSAVDADAAEPATATAPDGSEYVIWVEHQGDGGADVMVARFDKTGQLQGSPKRVNPESGKATAWRGDPPTIAVSRDGVVYVGWTARTGPSSAQANDLYLSASRDNGQSFGAPVRVNDDKKPAVHGMHSLLVNGNGHLFLAWLDERNVVQPQSAKMAAGHHMESNREVFTAFSTDGGQTFSPNQRVATDACPCCKTALAVGPDDHVYIGWRQVLPGDFRHIAVANSVNGGKSFSPAVIVSDDRWQIAGCPVSGPSFAIGDDGALRVLWYSAGSAGETGLYLSESSDGGRTFAPRRLFQSGQVSGTPVLLTGENHTLSAVWGMGVGSASHLMTAKLDGDGQVTKQNGAMSSELPSAAQSGGRLFVAYISKSGDRRSIWLART